MAFSDTSSGATADIFRSKAEERYFYPSRHNYEDWSAALKSFSGSESEQDTAFQRELEALEQIEGVGKAGAFDRWLQDQEDAAVAEEEAAADAAEEAAQAEEEEKLAKRKSRSKSRVTSPYGILQPANISKKRLTGA